ncbi:MAG: hypothetical protein KDI75_05740 [Xanthomonadales bacterium]|nr:hypothetical protein [Xanthomonadales bacterium]
MSDFADMQAAAEAADTGCAAKRQASEGGWHCIRCLGTEYESGEIHVAGSLLGKLFDVQGTKFSRVTCGRCRYTEFYHAPSSELGNLFDLFVG